MPSCRTAIRRCTIADRAADLLARMSIDEKLSQLGSVWVFQIANGRGFDAERARPRCSPTASVTSRGSVARAVSRRRRPRTSPTRSSVTSSNTPVSAFPPILHEEICSGLMAREAAVFPQALGVAATFRPELNRRLADAVRAQMRAMGSHQGLSPVLDICRDPRWGRLEESYGEDPFLVSQMGIGFITGLQGSDDGRDLSDGVVATAKHFVGYGASEGGMNWAPAHIPERELRDVYLRPFEAAVRDAGLASVMNAYQELDGIPCAANRWLLTDLLRGEWGFDGTVVSDYFAIKQLDDYHRDRRIVGRRRRHRARPPASTSSCRAPSATATCCARRSTAVPSRWPTSMRRSDVRSSRSYGSACSSARTSMSIGSPCTRGQPTRSSSPEQLATESLVLLRNDGILPLRPGTHVDRRDRAERRQRPPHARRLQLHHARRVADRSAEVGRQRVRHADRPRHATRRAHRPRTHRHGPRRPRRRAARCHRCVTPRAAPSPATIDQASPPPSRPQRRATSRSW